MRLRIVLVGEDVSLRSYAYGRSERCRTERDRATVSECGHKSASKSDEKYRCSEEEDERTFLGT